MKIALTHNLRRSDSEAEAEFDSAETVESITAALAAGGHEVEAIEVSCSVQELMARIASSRADLIFNTAEGRRGRTREAFFPTLFDALGQAYTGSDAHTLTITLDKWLSKTVLSRHGIDTPRAILVTPAHRPRLDASLDVTLPVIVKPNYEGSSKGISDAMVSDDWRRVRALVEQQLAAYPEGVLVEEFVPGVDVAVPFVAGLGDEGVLCPTEYVVDTAARSRFNLYDYHLKNFGADAVMLRCPAHLPRDAEARLRALGKVVTSLLGVRDIGRIDFRLGDDGRLVFIEVNATPSLQPDAAIFAASSREGLGYEETILHIVSAAAQRCGLGRAADHARSSGAVELVPG